MTPLGDAPGDEEVATGPGCQSARFRRSGWARALVWWSAPAAVLAFLGCGPRPIDPHPAGAGGDASVAGAGGTAGAAGRGGSATQDSGRAGGPAICPPVPQTHCTETGAWPSGDYDRGPCDHEGNVCDGGQLIGDGFGCYLQSWSLQCCAGRWYPTPIDDAGAPVACPTAGTPFSCGDTGLSCVVGQTACAQSFDRATSGRTYACSNLCSAGDCSCFCVPSNAQGGCSYTVPDPKEPSDCDCYLSRGEVITSCTHGKEPDYSCARDPSTDSTCTVDYPLAYACLSPEVGLESIPYQLDCVRYDDSVPDHWCCRII